MSFWQILGRLAVSDEGETIQRVSDSTSVIGFENNGKLIISPVTHRPSLERMGVETEQIVHVGGFSSGQKQFLDFHRNSVFLESRR